MRHIKFFHLYLSIVSVVGTFNCIWFSRRIFFENNPKSFESDLIGLCEGGTLFLTSLTAHYCLYRVGKQQNLSVSDANPETKNEINSIQRTRTLDSLPSLTITSSARKFRSTNFLIGLIESEQKKISRLEERGKIVDSFINFLNQLKNITLTYEQNKDDQIISKLKELLTIIADKISDYQEDNSIGEFLQNRKTELEQQGMQFFINTLDKLVIPQFQKKISEVYPQLE